MNIRTKLITIILIASCITMPILANAVTSSSAPTGFLGSITSLFQSGWNFISNIFSPKAPAVSSTVLQTSGRDYITLELGSKSVLVAVLQQTLIKNGYLTSPATGIFDAKTQVAVEALQKAEKIPVTGSITIATSSLAALFSNAAPAFAPITVGATGTRATNLQKFLIAKGNLKIATATTYFGTATQAAVKAFQASHDLPQTGVVDKATFAAMNGE
jgi:peptidoglycan hydrolase-like protein with peptidoglycan-binding domain